MTLHAASLKHALKTAMMLSLAAILGFALMSATPAYAKHGGKGPAPDGQSDEAGDSGGGSENSNGNGNNSGDDGNSGDGDSSELKPNKPSPQDEPTDDSGSSASSDEKPMVFMSSRRDGGQTKAALRKAKKELARLFALSDPEISSEFPSGGFDAALVQAASRARKAERAYRRANR